MAVDGDKFFLPLPPGEGRGEGSITENNKPKKKSALPEKLLKYARELRVGQTDAEQLLWKLLRNRQIADAKFRRQHPIENYILDFYCHEKKLAIELDGSQHLEEKAQEYDANRSQFLEQQGITVLRFDNRQMLIETEEVLSVIYETLTPNPSPERRGEPINPTPRTNNPPLPPGEGLGVREQYQDIAGYCKSATLDEIKANDNVLTPGRYVGAAPIEDDGIPFETKMAELSKTLYQQMKDGEKLDAVIRKNLEVLGYGG